MKYAKLLLVCVVVLLWVLSFSTTAHAAGDDLSADKDLAQQQGLDNKEIDQSKLPGKLQYAIVIGSVIAAVGVIKFV